MKKKILVAVLAVLSAACCGLAVSGCSTSPDEGSSGNNGIVSDGGNEGNSGNQGSSGNEGSSGNQGSSGNEGGNTGSDVSGKGYKVTVYGADGEPFSGAEVEIDGEVAFTGADGAVEFADTVWAEYDIDVYAEGYVVTHQQKTGDEEEYSVYLSKVAENKVFSCASFGTVRYAVSVGWEDDPEMANMITPETLTYTVKNTGSTPALFTIKLNDKVAFASFENAPRHSIGIFGNMGPSDPDYKPVSVVLEENETFAFNLTADYTAFASQEKENYPVVYDVEIISEQAPAKGTSKLYMFDALPVGTTEQTVAANMPVYFKFDSTASQFKGSDFRITYSDADLSIEDLGTSASSVAGTKITSGQAIAGNDYYARVLLVKSGSGNISFTSAAEIPEGTVNNPLRLTSNDSGNSYSGTTVNNDRERQKWYTITNETQEAKKYTIVPDATSGSNMVAYVYNSSGNTVAYSVEGKSLWFEVPAGATYKIAVNNTTNVGAYAFTFRDYNAATDIGGDSYNNPITYIVQNGEQSYNVTLSSGDTGGKFFTFETAEAGFYTVSVECDDENVSTTIADRFITDKGDSMENHAMVLDNTLFTSKTSVCIKMMRYSTETDTVWTIKINFVPLVAVDNTVTVSGDAEIIGGLTVNIKKDGQVVATGVTGNDGVAHVSFVPGVYDIEITGFDTNTHGYNPVQTTFALQGGDFAVDIAKTGAYTFTVKNPDDSVVGNATVTLMSGDTVVATGTTDADGVFTTDVLVLGEYDVVFTPVSKIGNYLEPFRTNADEQDVTLVLKAPATIKHASDNSVPSIEEGVTVITNSAIRTGRYNYQFTAQTAGTYVITMDTTASSIANTDGIKNVYLSVDGTTVSNDILNNGDITSDILTADEETKGVNGSTVVYRSITVELEEGQTIGLALYIYSYSAIKGVINIVKL